MYNLRARVRAPASGSIRTQGEVRVLAPPRTVASQVTPSQALKLLSEASTVPESEVPLVEVGMIDKANEIDQSNLTMKDMLVVSSETENALVSATAVYTDDDNTCLLYTSPSPRDGLLSRMPSSAVKKTCCRV